MSRSGRMPRDGRYALQHPLFISGQSTPVGSMTVQGGGGHFAENRAIVPGEAA
jgi:hypothetical protein